VSLFEAVTATVVYLAPPTHEGFQGKGTVVLADLSSSILGLLRALAASPRESVVGAIPRRLTSAPLADPPGAPMSSTTKRDNASLPNPSRKRQRSPC
jgi:hypothetical protein